MKARKNEEGISFEGRWEERESETKVLRLLRRRNREVLNLARRQRGELVRKEEGGGESEVEEEKLAMVNPI